MKLSIRTKFSLGMVFIFIIILGLLGFSAFSLVKLSRKTGAILSENHVSVVYAREMTENLMLLNKEMYHCYITSQAPDTILIKNEFDQLDKTIQAELSNITEAGEDKLAATIQQGINDHKAVFRQFIQSPKQVDIIQKLQNRFDMLTQQLALLSQMNEKAIEVKTMDAKVSSKNALTQLSVIGTLCFLISLSFIYSFASYFNERFFQLYNGIKEIVSSNFGQRLYFDGKDEFYEISLLFNQMAEKLEGTNLKKPLYDFGELENDDRNEDLEKLKSLLTKMKTLESQVTGVISKADKK
ncbi:MAG TPA: MCP four helix bundle domain-containing protein [Prolixibacteraceae bacterium]|nr:MCP four helix bundle domain-containing protein [Prolixibacteraceae bacterium]